MACPSVTAVLGERGPRGVAEQRAVLAVGPCLRGLAAGQEPEACSGRVNGSGHYEWL